MSSALALHSVDMYTLFYLYILSLAPELDFLFFYFAHVTFLHMSHLWPCDILVRIWGQNYSGFDFGRTKSIWHPKEDLAMLAAVFLTLSLLSTKCQLLSTLVSSMQFMSNPIDWAHAVEFDPAKLSDGEVFWHEHQKWLEGCGYMLRDRYMPGWKPSWLNAKKRWYTCEDGQIPAVCCVVGLRPLTVQLG
jgi:hypothetical protein